MFFNMQISAHKQIAAHPTNSFAGAIRYKKYVDSPFSASFPEVDHVTIYIKLYKILRQGLKYISYHLL